MKMSLCSLALAGAVLLAGGCYTPYGEPDRTASGALGGGAIGAGTGAIIGSASGHAGEGALIGGAIGALTGGLIGNAQDEAARARIREESPDTLTRIDQGAPLKLEDIKAMSAAGVSDEVILSQIRNSRTIFRLSSTEIIDLHDAGVSNRVIDFMINTPSLYAPRRYYRYYY